MCMIGLERIDLTAPGLPERVRVFGDASKDVDSLDLHGRADLLSTAGLGLCGARDASQHGVELARVVGAVAAELRVPLVSGYARGVDTAGHVAALAAGGSTVAVLAEGIEQFRLREEYRGLDATLDGLTVVSQFYSAATWTVGRAMARNSLICALSAVVIVIEPGESGGTIAAARETLRTSRDGRKQPQPLMLVLRQDHDDARMPAVAGIRRREGVTCVENATELEAEIVRTLAAPDAHTTARLF